MIKMVVIGIGLAGVLTMTGGVWLWWQHQQTVIADSSGGSIAISGNATAASSVAPSVAPSVSQMPTVAPAPARAPETPAGFSEYAQYRDSATPLFTDVASGTGTEAKVGSAVTVDYKGWLTTGQEFDESFARHQPFSFVVGQGQVIAGWDQGVQGMKVGGQRRLVIPSKFAYGDRVTGQIPPDSLLVFDIWLRAVK
jgi:hypothetical protein